MDFTIKLSKHAIERLKERRISRFDVEDAINNPYQLTYDTWKDVYIAVSVKGIAVVYAQHGRFIEVLTVLGRREYEALISKYGCKRYRILW